mgnify:CR=1 FL=1
MLCLRLLKFRDPHEVGTKVIVQGGTFLNDAVLRSFEQLAETNAVRPDIAGNMGAYGAALLARDRAHDLEAKTGAPAHTTMLDLAALEALEPTHRNIRCKACSNHCLLTINDFGIDESTGKHRRFITGNRCEKGAGLAQEASKVPNLFDYKTERMFNHYTPLTKEEATRSSVGIPRALNMYENYPFWFTFFTKLGFRVVLSDPSTKKTYEAGIESMPSESVCYPAKLSHGHIMNLLDKDIDFIWMPCAKYERQEDETAGNHFNCPIVMSYSEALKLNVDALNETDIQFLNPFVPYHLKDKLKERLYVELVENHPELMGSGALPTKEEIAEAVDAAWAEDEQVHEDIHQKGMETLEWIEEHGVHGIVLAGRPYHGDPEINHAIPELLTSFGLAVFTEDSVAHMGQVERPLRAVDQWMYHTRLYRAAKVVTQRDDLDLIQLNSFGCGLDAITTDQVQEILEGSGKIYTVLKIDEVSNLGAARIRVRSLLAALKDQAEERAEQNALQGGCPVCGFDGDQLEADVRAREAVIEAKTGKREAEAGAVIAAEIARESAEEIQSDRRIMSQEEEAALAEALKGNHALKAESTAFPKVQFTKEMKEAGYTILCPQMAPIHFDLLLPIFNANGYNNNYNSQNNYQMPPKQMDLSPLSTGEWLLTLIVGIIPCAGLILYIIWAFGNSGNLNRRNYCRASLNFSGYFVCTCDLLCFDCSSWWY